ncbi:MAG: hypothetical protein ABIQ18_47470 [Umezawaea sp.]
MTALLWTVLVASVVVFGVAVTLRAGLAYWASKGNSGSEYLFMALRPLFLVEVPLKFAGALSGLVLAVRLDSSPTWQNVAGTLGWVLVFLCALEVVRYFRVRKSLRDDQRRYDDLRRVISQDEMLGLIRSRTIKSFFRRQDGCVRFRYAEEPANDNDRQRPTTADPRGYPAYVAAANDLRPQDGHTVTHHDDYDPDDIQPA